MLLRRHRINRRFIFIQLNARIALLLQRLHTQSQRILFLPSGRPTRYLNKGLPKLLGNSVPVSGDRTIPLLLEHLLVYFLYNLCLLQIPNPILIQLLEPNMVKLLARRHTLVLHGQDAALSVRRLSVREKSSLLLYFVGYRDLSFRKSLLLGIGLRDRGILDLCPAFVQERLLFASHFGAENTFLENEFSALRLVHYVIFQQPIKQPILLRPRILSHLISRSRGGKYLGVLLWRAIIREVALI